MNKRQIQKWKGENIHDKSVDHTMDKGKNGKRLLKRCTTKKTQILNSINSAKSQISFYVDSYILTAGVIQKTSVLRLQFARRHIKCIPLNMFHPRTENTAKGMKYEIWRREREFWKRFPSIVKGLYEPIMYIVWTFAQKF